MDVSSLSPDCTLRLLLLRHGRPNADAAGRCHGQFDVELSDEGREQIRKKSEILSGLRADALYSSPSKRAFESALILGQSMRVQPRVIPELQEINFGEFEGRSYEEIRQSQPMEYELWMTHPTRVAFPGGESFAAFRKRVLRFLAKLMKAHERKIVVVCSHSGVNRVILAHALGLAPRNIFRIDQAYAALNIVDFVRSSPIVRLING